MLIVEKSMHPGWLSNTWLIGDRPGGKAVIVDSGAPMAPIVERIRALDLELTHVLCTHHHIDHVANNEAYQRQFGCPVCGHARERKWFGELDLELAHGEELVTGGLHVRALHIPGHTVGQLAFLINEDKVFTGDTLFRGSVGGTRAPGHTTYEDIRHSIMEVLMALPKDTEVYPGHMEATTIGQEWEANPFIQAWRATEQAQGEACTAFGETASLLLEAPDYDGGTKCWVRFEDGGKLDIVPGSRVRRVGT